jgi:hypothetical protein
MIIDLKSVDNIFIYALMAAFSQVAMLARFPLTENNRGLSGDSTFQTVVEA